VVRQAEEQGTHLTPRGAGSGMPGGNVGPGTMVDLSQGFTDLAIDPAARRARTGASVSWAQLSAAARPHGLRLPPDPSSGAFATCGGLVSTNAAGPRSVRYGSVRPWIRSLEVVLAGGEVRVIRRGGGAGPWTLTPDTRDLVARQFPRTRKSSSGYALDAFAASGDEVDLFIGAEGTLGIVTAVEWRLDPIPRETAGVALALGDLAALGEAASYLTSLDPSAVELLDRTLLEFVAQAGGAVPAGADCLILAEFERDTPSAVRGVVGDAVRGLKHLTVSVETALSQVELKRLWSVRRLASPALARLPETRRSLQVIEDGCVPLAELARYVAGVRQAAREQEIPVAIFGHAGDGHVHVNALPDLTRSDWLPATRRLFEEVSGLQHRLGGTATGEHGDGRLRAGLLERFFGSALVARFADLKRAYDPRGVFNPGVILPAPGWSPLAHLKVGTDAAPIPELVAARLRDLERTGGWATLKPDLAR
jgi:FAD/FMN-containing dehydrogenase